MERQTAPKYPNEATRVTSQAKQNSPAARISAVWAIIFLPRRHPRLAHSGRPLSNSQTSHQHHASLTSLDDSAVHTARLLGQPPLYARLSRRLSVWSRARLLPGGLLVSICHNNYPARQIPLRRRDRASQTHSPKPSALTARALAGQQPPRTRCLCSHGRSDTPLHTAPLFNRGGDHNRSTTPGQSRAT